MFIKDVYDNKFSCSLVEPCQTSRHRLTVKWEITKKIVLQTPGILKESTKTGNPVWPNVWRPIMLTPVKTWCILYKRFTLSIFLNLTFTRVNLYQSSLIIILPSVPWKSQYPTRTGKYRKIDTKRKRVGTPKSVRQELNPDTVNLMLLRPNKIPKFERRVTSVKYKCVNTQIIH